MHTPVRTALLLYLVFSGMTAQAQAPDADSRGGRELLPASDPVYRFLLRQQVTGNLHNFHWGMLPLSRKEVASFLDSLETSTTLSVTDRALLHDFERKLSYDRTGGLASSSSFIPGFDFGTIVDDSRQKYLYAYADSTTSVFLDGFASYSYRAGKGDSLGSHFASLGEVGLRLRGTLYNRLGYYLQASNGALLSGSHDFALLEPRLQANKKFNSDQKSFFDFTNGYLRYDADWFSVMAGREQLLWGMGYGDRMVFSDNTVPFDFFRIDIHSGNLHYSFLHGGLVGADTNGQTLSSKYIAAHRLEFNIGAPLRLGLNEAVIYSNQPPLFALMNPMAFLTSAELSTELTSSNEHNTLIWIDAEVRPVTNVRLNGTWLIDDISFSTLGKQDISGNTNKFGWQAGVLWSDAFTVPTLVLSLEYTRIGPFVETHRTNANSYTNWNLPLGAALQPNSDEWALGADYDVTNRLSISCRVRFQRTGENILDQSGRVIFNAGSNFLYGEGDVSHPNVFLEGRRINRVLGSIELIWQPVWQYSFDVQYFYRSFRFPAEARMLNDSIVWMTFRVDY